MNTEKILKIIEQLLADLCMAKSCLGCEAEISSRIANNGNLIHEDFFLLARSSFLYTGTIILCKAFEKDDRNSPFSIYQLIKWIYNTIKLNEKQQEMLTTIESGLGELSPIIEKLKDQRNKFYAHNDKCLIDQCKFDSLSNLTRKEKNKLIDFGIHALSKLQAVCKKEEYVYYDYCDQSTMRLKCVFNDLNSFYEILKIESEELHKEIEDGQIV